MDRGAAAAAEASPPGGAPSASACVSASGTGSSSSSRARKRRRSEVGGGGGSGSSRSSRRRPAFSQQSFPIVRGSTRGGAEQQALLLLRLPEDVALPPAEVDAFLYAEEEVVIEEEGGEGGREEDPQRRQQRRQQLLRRRARPSLQWVLESEEQQQQQGQARLTGQKQPLVDPKEPHCQYFVLRINDGEEEQQGSAGLARDGPRPKQRKRCELLPLEDVIVLRQASSSSSRAGEENEEVRAYLEGGRRMELQARTWRTRYGAAGRALVAAWDACAGGEDEQGIGGRKRQKAAGEGEGEGPQRRWVRTFRVDEDADAGEDSFNPSSKVAPSYQDIFGGADDGEMEAVARVFAEADLGGDEVPDGADADGFNAAEFGEEDYIRARDGQEQQLWLERNAPASIDPVLLEMQGLVGEDDDDEDDAAVYGTSSSDSEEEGGEGGCTGRGLLGKGPGRAVAATVVAAASSSSWGGKGGMVFAEGFVAVDRARFGSETSDDYDGDDDGSEDDG